MQKRPIIPMTANENVWRFFTRLSVPYLLLLAATLWASCHLIQFYLATRFSDYDDEGYMLLSILNYIRGGQLYTEVFSQYGPFYYQVMGGLFNLFGFDVTHDSGRFFTFALWLLSGLLSGYFVFRISNSALLASAATLSCIWMETVLANEPGHPQQLVLPLLLLACCASLPIGRGTVNMFLIGAIGSALVFTKINVGGLYLAAVAQTMMCCLPSSRLRTTGLWVSLMFAISAPVLLMRRDVPGWATAFCIVAVLGGAVTYIAGSVVASSQQLRSRNVRYVAFGVLSSAGLIVMAAILRGMSLSTLLDGIVLAPLRHPGVFQIALIISNASMLKAALAAVGVVVLLCCRHRAWAQSEKIDSLRCIIGLYAIWGLLQDPAALAWVVPLVPLSLIPPHGRVWSLREYLPRLFVATLTVMQFLHVYPVAGSHRNITAALALLWAFICIHDGVSGLTSLLPSAFRTLAGSFSPKSMVGGALALTLATLMTRSVPGAWSDKIPSSGLPGSASLHMPAPWERSYLFLSNGIRTNCDVLFTLPGMGSLNLWSGVSPPNGLNMGAWMRAFSQGQQLKILGALKANKRACAVYNPRLTEGWGTPVSVLVNLPLASYVLNEMRVVATSDDYSVRVHPQRSSPWIDMSENKWRVPVYR